MSLSLNPNERKVVTLVHKLANDPRGVVVVKEVKKEKPDHNMNLMDNDACYRKSCRMIMNLGSCHGDGETYCKRDR